MDKIAEYVMKNESYIIGVRRYLHAHPELSDNEYETSKFIQSQLETMDIGYEVIEGRSIVGEIKGNQKGKTVAIRADMDALPLKEQTGLEFKSINDGIMHACGHDCHVAMLLGTAKVLSENRNEINGNVKFVFQESEELGTGAEKIMNTDLLEDVDNIIGLHITPNYKVGKINIGYGPRTTQGDWVTINIKGKGGHASRPSETRNAVMIGNEIIAEVNKMYSQEIDRRDFVIVVPTYFESGDKYNIIPEKAKVVFDIRYYDDKYEKILKDKIERIVCNVCNSNDAEGEVIHQTIVKVVVNEKNSVDRMIDVVNNMDTLDVENPESFSGGEDFSCYLTKIQGAFGFIGSGATDNEIYGLHNQHMMVNEGVLTRGTEFEVRYVLDYLKNC